MPSPRDPRLYPGWQVVRRVSRDDVISSVFVGLLRASNEGAPHATECVYDALTADGIIEREGDA